jgi:hypothetical protein
MSDGVPWNMAEEAQKLAIERWRERQTANGLADREAFDLWRKGFDPRGAFEMAALFQVWASRWPCSA